MHAVQPEVVTRAADLAAKIRSTNRRSSFEAAVREFERLLETVPDHAVWEIASASIDLLTRAGDDVIDTIEERIATADDLPAFQLELANTVYAIRYALEDIDRWRRHYALR